MAIIKFSSVEYKVVKKVCDLIEELGYQIKIEGECFVLEKDKTQ